MFYLIIIIISACLIAASNMLSLPFSWVRFGELSLSVAIGVVAVIALDGIVALIIRRLTPMSWYHPKRKFFEVKKRERDLYNRLCIKKWKELVPELGLFTGFSKSELKETCNIEYLERFLIESNYGMVIHLANAVFGFLIMLIPHCSSPSIWIPIFAVNFILSLMPVAVLRYTAYTLLRLYRRSRK